MKEKCSVCQRRLGLLSTECRTLHSVGEESVCERCTVTLAALALRLTVPDMRGLAAAVSGEMSKSGAKLTHGEAVEIRARMVGSAFLPDVTAAVEATLRVVEGLSLADAARDSAREILQALIHTKHVPTAKRFVEQMKKGA